MQGAPNVIVLRTLVSSREHDHQGRASLRIVHAVSGAAMDTQLEHILANVLLVARISIQKPIKPSLNPPARFKIAQTVYPPFELRGFAQFDHERSVANRIHLGKRRLRGNGQSGW